MMTAYQLRAFLTAAKCLNVTKAADMLHVSQSAITRQLKLLQNDLGIELYAKTSWGIRLTELGEIFRVEATQIVDELDKLEAQFPGHRKRKQPAVIRVAASSAPSFDFLPRLLACFLKTHSRTRVSFQAGTSLVIDAMLRKNEVDVAVVTDHSASPDFVYEPCRQEELVFFTSRKRSFGGRALSLAELESAPVVHFARGMIGNDQMLKRLSKRGIKLNVVMHCESVEGVKIAVKAGVGVGLLPKDCLSSEIARGDFEIVRVPGVDLTLQSSIAYRKAPPLSREAEDFVTLLRESRAARCWQEDECPRDVCVVSASSTV